MEISEYRGHDFVSIRTWTEKNDSKERVPTKKGITLNRHLATAQSIKGARSAASTAPVTGSIVCQRPFTLPFKRVFVKRA